MKGGDWRDGRKEQKVIHGTIWVCELVTVGFKACLGLFLVPGHDQSLTFPAPTSKLISTLMLNLYIRAKDVF